MVEKSREEWQGEKSKTWWFRKAIGVTETSVLPPYLLLLRKSGVKYLMHDVWKMSVHLWGSKRQKEKHPMAESPLVKYQCFFIALHADHYFQGTFCFLFESWQLRMSGGNHPNLCYFLNICLDFYLQSPNFQWSQRTKYMGIFKCKLHMLCS